MKLTSEIRAKIFATTCCLILLPTLSFADGIASDLPEVRSALRIGAAVGFTPKYEGSDKYRAFGLPIIDLGDTGIGRYVTLNSFEDVRFNILRFNGFVAGPLTGYTLGRKEKDGVKLKGLGNIDDSAILGAFATYRWEVFYLDASYHHQVTGDENGYQMRLKTGMEMPVTENWVAFASTGMTYADDNYMQSNFGVTTAQSVASTANLKQFRAKAGIKDVNFEIGSHFSLSENWLLTSSLSYKRLLSDAASSPAIDTKNQFTGAIGLTYLFKF